VVHANVNAKITRDVVGNLQESAKATVRRSGVLVLHHQHMNAQVVRLVENARESARIMKDVASRRRDGANETVRKDLVLMEFVKVAMMILK